MVGMLATGTAVLADDKFFGGVGFVSFRDIVEMPAFGAF